MKKYLSLAACLAVSASPVNALDLEDASVTFNGYASIVAGSTLSNEDKFPPGGDPTGTIFYEDEATFELGSRAALQANADLGEGLSFTAQFLAEGVNDYTSETQWAYVGYQINDEMKINVGRIVLPLYLYSDFLKVGYAYHWLRMPGTVYSANTSVVEGVSFLHNTWLGDWESTVQVTSTLDGFHGAAWNIGLDTLSFRFAHYYAKIDPSPFEAQGLALKAGGEQDIGSDIIQEVIGFSALGVRYDHEHFFTVAEYIDVDWSAGLMGSDQTAYYLSVGKRINEYTVSLTHGNRDSSESTSLLNDLNSIPAGPLSGVTGPLLGILAAGQFDEDETTLSVRYDFHSNAALKVELSKFKDNLDSDNDSNLLLAGIDLVF